MHGRMLKQCHANTASTHFKIAMMERVPFTCMGETAAAGAVLTGIPLRGLLGTLWTEIFCPVLPVREEHGNNCISKPTIFLSSEQWTNDEVTFHRHYWTKHWQKICTKQLHHKTTKNTYSLLKKSSITKYTVPEHPKSNDFISDFTVAADSDGVGDALLMQTPCQRLLVSASIDSTSSAVSLQSRKQIKVSGNRKCKQRLKVFICSKANPTMHIFNCNAQNMYPLLQCSCSCFGVPSRY